MYERNDQDIYFNLKMTKRPEEEFFLLVLYNKVNFFCCLIIIVRLIFLLYLYSNKMTQNCKDCIKYETRVSKLFFIIIIDPPKKKIIEDFLKLVLHASNYFFFL